MGGVDEVPGAEVDGTATGADEGRAVVVEVAGACEACAGGCAAVGAVPVTGAVGACVGAVELDEAVELDGAAAVEAAGAGGEWVWLLLCNMEAYESGVDEPWCEVAPCDAGVTVDDTGCAEILCKNKYINCLFSKGNTGGRKWFWLVWTTRRAGWSFLWWWLLLLTK